MSADTHSISDQRRAPGESGAEGFEQHQVATLYAAIFYGNVQCQRYGRTRRIRVLVDSHDDALHGQIQLLRGCGDYSQIGLMWHQPRQLTLVHAVLFQRLPGDCAECTDWRRPAAALPCHLRRRR